MVGPGSKATAHTSVAVARRLYTVIEGAAVPESPLSFSYCAKHEHVKVTVFTISKGSMPWH